MVDRDGHAPPRFERDEPAITVLHVSDLQFGKYHRFADPAGGFDTLLRRLCDDLDLLAGDHGLVPDVVALTGDLAEWGMRSEFEQVAAFCEQLCDHLKLTPDRLLVVPGNHDINRKLCSAYFDRCAGDDEEPARAASRAWSRRSARRGFGAITARVPCSAEVVAQPTRVVGAHRGVTTCSTSRSPDGPAPWLVIGLRRPSPAGRDVGMQDRAHTPDLAAAPDLGPLPAPAADLGLATALLRHLQAIGRLTPNDVTAALQRYPRLREAVLRVVAAHRGAR